LTRKLPNASLVRTIHCDSSKLRFEDGIYDQAVLFLLLHEMPEDVRRKTLSEAIRVLRAGGRLVIVDYHLPSQRHPLRYLFRPVLRWLEPFAVDLWSAELSTWLPQGFTPAAVAKQTSFGGLYQKLVITI
jgi:ubiquinone/menaquinone biosynthesis C-methylase UbiE